MKSHDQLALDWANGKITLDDALRAARNEGYLAGRGEGFIAGKAAYKTYVETERLALHTLVNSWPHQDNGQEYRRAVIQCRAAVLAELGFCPKDGEPMPCMTCGAGL